MTRICDILHYATRISRYLAATTNREKLACKTTSFAGLGIDNTRGSQYAQ